MVYMLYKTFSKRQNWFVLFRESCLYGITNNGKQESDYPNSQDSNYILEKVGVYSDQDFAWRTFRGSVNVLFFTYLVIYWLSLCGKSIEHRKKKWRDFHKSTTQLKILNIVLVTIGTSNKVNNRSKINLTWKLELVIGLKGISLCDNTWTTWI